MRDDLEMVIKLLGKWALLKLFGWIRGSRVVFKVYGDKKIFLEEEWVIWFIFCYYDCWRWILLGIGILI